MLPWSVMPTAGCPSAAAAATTSPIRDAPSSIEYSVWRWRWTNESPKAVSPSRPAPAVPAAWGQTYTRVICTVAGLPAVRTGPLRGRCPECSGGAGPWPGRQLAADLLELLAGGHLLGEERRLDAVEEALEPAHELRLGDPQLGLARRVARRTAGPAGRARRGGRATAPPPARAPSLVDVPEPLAAGLVERGRAHLVEQLLDHRADPHHLRRLLDRLGVDLGCVGPDPRRRASITSVGWSVSSLMLGTLGPPHRAERHERHEHLVRASASRGAR